MVASRSGQGSRPARDDGRVSLGTRVASRSGQWSRPARKRHLIPSERDTLFRARVWGSRGLAPEQREREGMGCREREGKLLWTVVPPVPYKNAFINGNLYHFEI